MPLNIETIRHKLHLLTDQMVDAAHDMQQVDNLTYVAQELLKMSESLSNVADALPVPALPKAYPIGTGDHVFHMPSQSSFVVMQALDDCLISAEEPSVMVFTKDCRLIYKATGHERLELLSAFANGNDQHDLRVDYARKQLALLNAEQTV